MSQQPFEGIAWETIGSRNSSNQSNALLEALAAAHGQSSGSEKIQVIAF